MALVKHDYPILEYDTASKDIFQTGNGKKHFPKKAVFAFLGDEVEKYAHAHSGIQIDEFESATKLYPSMNAFIIRKGYVYVRLRLGVLLLSRF